MEVKSLNYNNKYHQNLSFKGGPRSYFGFFIKKSTPIQDNFCPAEHVNFVKVESVRNAKEYAENILGIKKFNVNNISMANWVNKALQNVHNIYKGNYIKPERIGIKNPRKDTENVLISTTNNGLFINNSFIKRLDKKIISLYNAIFNKTNRLTPIINRKEMNNIQQYMELYKARRLSIPAKIHMYSDLKDYMTECRYLYNEKRVAGHTKYFTNELNNLRLFKNKPPMEEFINPTYYALRYVIEDLNKLGYPPAYFTRSINKDVYSPIYREIGHLQHMKSAGNEYTKLLTPFDENSDISKYICENVSAKAMKSPAEFVAEVFSARLTGNKLNSDIMSLYSKYKGPEIPNS